MKKESRAMLTSTAHKEKVKEKWKAHPSMMPSQEGNDALILYIRRQIDKKAIVLALTTCYYRPGILQKQSPSVCLPPSNASTQLFFLHTSTFLSLVAEPVDTKTAKMRIDRLQEVWTVFCLLLTWSHHRSLPLSHTLQCNTGAVIEVHHDLSLQK